MLMISSNSARLFLISWHQVIPEVTLLELYCQSGRCAVEKKDSNATPHQWLTGPEYEQRVLSFTPARAFFPLSPRKKTPQLVIEINIVSPFTFLSIQPPKNLSVCETF